MLSPSVQVVYMWICNFADSEGQCFPSVKLIAECAGVSDRCVYKSINELEKIGILSHDTRKNGKENLTNLYQIEMVDSGETITPPTEYSSVPTELGSVPPPEPGAEVTKPTLSNSIHLSESVEQSSPLKGISTEQKVTTTRSSSNLTFEEYMSEMGYEKAEVYDSDGGVVDGWSHQGQPNKVLSQGKLNTLMRDYRNRGNKGVIVEKPKFNSDTALLNLAKSNNKKDKIIALFFRSKGYVFENAPQMQTQVMRFSKAAAKLIGYSSDQLKEIMEYVEDDSVRRNYDWSLETIIKKAAEVINKK